MSEFDVLINTICNPISSIENRSNAERRLLDLLSDLQTWSQHLPSLFTANDTICFFIGIGYQRLVWRHWFRLSAEGRDALTNTLTSVLMTRGKMSSFAKAKLEQVLAAICVNSMTLQPVLNLLVDCNQPGAYNGLSAMRTVMDTVLSEDPKIDPNTRQTLENASESVIVPLTNLACNACMNALQSYNEENSGLMIVSLELMKTIVAKLPIGPHITVDVLNLMFTIAELGADQQSVFHQSALSSMEILTEIMQKKYIPPDNSDPGQDPNNNNSNNNKRGGSGGDRSLRMMMHIINKTIELLQSYREHGSIDDSAIVLSLLDFISVFSESHLERCLQHSHFGLSSPSSSSLTTNHSSNHSNSMSEESRSLTQNITTFFTELVAMTTVSMDPKILIKIVSVWNRILTIEGVKHIILSQSNVCVPIIAHLLQASLLQSNKNLQENLDDLIEDLKLDFVVDPHIKEILTKISTISSSSSSSNGDNVLSSSGGKGSGESHHSHNGGAAARSSAGIPRPSPSSSQGDRDFFSSRNREDLYGVEEFNYIGSTLLTDVTDLFAELVLSHDAKHWLQSTVNNLLLQNINLLSANFQQSNSSSSTSNSPFPSSHQNPTSPSSSSSASPSKASKAQMKHYTLDLCFLIRLLPMVSDNKAELVLQMITFLLQIIENNKIVTNGFSKAISKEMIVLPLNCCQIVGQILQSCLSAVSFSSTFTPSLVQWCKILEPMITLLAQGMIEYVTIHPSSSSTSSSSNHSQSHEIIFQGIAILLAQTINLYAEFFDEKVQILYYSLTHNPPNSPNSGPSNASSNPANNSILVLKRQLEEMFQNIIAHPESVSLEVYALIVCSQDVLNAQSVAPMLLNQLIEASSMLENTLNNNNFNAIGNILDVITRITGSMDVLTRNHSISKAMRRQTLVQNFSPLQNIMIQLQSILLQVNLQCWKYVIVSRYNSSSLSSSNLSSFTMTWPLEKIHQSSRLTAALSCSLCQCLGKKTFGKTAADSFEVCVAFIETCTSSQNNAMAHNPNPNDPLLLPMLPFSAIANDANHRRIHSINPNNAVALLLFDVAGLRFLLQVLELSRILAESTAASNQNVSNQIQSTYRLIVAILPYLSDERVCAELLPSTLKAGITAIKCYWQRGQKTLSSTSPLSPTTGHHGNPFSQILSKQQTLGASDDSLNGVNVKPLVELLVQLCIGSLGQNIPPQDTHLALEGMISLRNQHNLFRVPWFHESLWLGLFLPCLRAIVLRMHDSNFHQLEELFIELCNSKIHYLEVQKNTTAVGGGVEGGNGGGNNNNNKVMVLQEFWYFVGQEMIKISGEYQCGDRVHELMTQTMSSYNWQTNGDSATCIRLVIFPIAAEISRRI